MRTIFDISQRPQPREAMDFMRVNRSKIENQAISLIDKNGFNLPIGIEQVFITAARINEQYYGLKYAITRTDKLNCDWRLKQVDHFETVDEYLDFMNDIKKAYESGKGKRVNK